MTDFAWTPDPELDASANATAFMRALGASDFEEMVRCGDEEPERFHSKLFEFIDYRFFKPYERILDESRGIEWAHWCPGGTTNVVLNTIDRWRDTPIYDKPAIVWEGEQDDQRTLTYRELDRQVCQLAAGLRSLGLGEGDVIGLYMPNIPEAVVALLAIPKIGAIVMPLFSGFGAEAMATRLEIAAAKALITVDGSTRRGRMVDVKAVVDAAAQHSPSLSQVVVLRHSGIAVEWTDGRDYWWDELIHGQPSQSPTEEMEADAPFLLVFTSGTTDKPKGVVHTHIGFPVKCLIDLWLVLDCKPEDRVLWISDMGWVIGPLLVYGVTVIGATLVLVEGAPNYPDPDRMWRVVCDQRVTYLGVAPTTIRTFLAQGSTPRRTYDLSRLRVMISSGEAWTENAWWWMFENVGGQRLPILNFSGGTEMIGIIGSTVKLPLKPCSCNCAIPGTGADVFREDGTSASPGEVGELVQRRPSIGLTRGLWHDSERYIRTYWSSWPNVWHHGDFVSRDADGQWFVHGRSDDTMKIAGKRTGPAEIESLLMATDKLNEAAAVGVPDPIKGAAIVIVCSPKTGVIESEELKEELSQAIVQNLGIPYRPKDVIFVSDLPKTRNMKIMRRIIRTVCSGDIPDDLSSLVNPQTVDELRQRAGR